MAKKKSDKKEEKMEGPKKDKAEGKKGEKKEMGQCCHGAGMARRGKCPCR